MEQSKKNIYVGIDHSLTSPGICILDPSGNPTWISLYSIEQEELDKLHKKKDNPFNTLKDSRSVKVHFIGKRTLNKDASYADSERSKLMSFSTQSADMLNLIMEQLEKMDDGTNNIHVGMEGISFGSSGNYLIDISQSTGIIRQALLDRLLYWKLDRFHVFSPMSIKKYAGKGNLKKDELYRLLLQRDDLRSTDHGSELLSLLAMNEGSWISPAGAVKKPIDDLVDSTWIALFLRDSVEGKLPLEEPKKPKKKKEKKL